MDKTYIIEEEILACAYLEDTKQKLAELLYLDYENYKQYSLIINNKYKSLMPAIFYTALSRGYKTIEFEDLKEEIVYKISKGEVK